MRRTAAAILAALALAGCGQAVVNAPPTPTPVAATVVAVPEIPAAPTPVPAPPLRDATPTSVASVMWECPGGLGSHQSGQIDLRTCTPVPLPIVMPSPMALAPATPAQTRAMLSTLDQVAAACGWTSDATANAVLGDEQYLARQGVTAWGSAPQVTAFLNDVLNQVRTANLLCSYAFGDAVLDVEVQQGILKYDAAGSLIPAHPTPVVVPPTPTLVDAPAK